MPFQSKARNPAQRLRTAVDSMPRFAREAMLRGIDANTIIAGAYADPTVGGICPMLAAHRNGGRTNLASFARSWDRYAGARYARLATERELRTLRTYLEGSLAGDLTGDFSVTELAEQIRSERAEFRAVEAADRRARQSARPIADASPKAAPGPLRRRRGSTIADTGETFRAHEMASRSGWSWTLPTRSYRTYQRRIAAAEEAMAEARAAEMLGRGDQVPNALASPGRV